MGMRNSRLQRRAKRKFRIRRKISGTAEKPRLSVFRSSKHIYCQAVDDLGGRTLAAASTMDKEVRTALAGYPGNRDAAAVVGTKLAERLKAQGVAEAVFDRGGNRFHGRVKALADAVREGGLQF